MSDIYCPRCAEPWGIDELHDTPEDLEFPDALREFRRVGCRVFGTRCNGNDAHPAIGEILALLGDDVDGAAALLDDFGIGGAAW